MAQKRGKGKSSHYRMTSVMVEPEIYDEFIEIIPRSKSVGEALREYMKSVVEEKRKEKNLSGSDHSAIGLVANNNIQSKLDKYFPSHITEWNSFKDIVEGMEETERTKLTEIWLHDFRILELTNQKMNGRKVYPFLKV
jgi:hypothetical protein